MRVWITLLLLVFTGFSRADEQFVESIEQAHGRDAWYSHTAVEADFVVNFQGSEMLRGTMLFDPSVGKSRIELADGTLLVFDGEQAYVSPAATELPMARFHLLTWPYFLAAPFKLSDPGSHVESVEPMPLDGEHAYPAARMTFDAGTGDSPDDWYILYRDPGNDHLLAMAYIVTYGAVTPEAMEKAESEPHAIHFHDFASIAGVTLATGWTLHPWSKEQGLADEMLGDVQLHNIRFVEPVSDAFTRPADARVDPQPQ